MDMSRRYYDKHGQYQGSSYHSGPLTSCLGFFFLLAAVIFIAVWPLTKFKSAGAGRWVFEVLWLAFVAYVIVWWARRKSKSKDGEVPTLAPSPTNKTGLPTSVPTSAAVDNPKGTDPPRAIGEDKRALHRFAPGPPDALTCMACGQPKQHWAHLV
jgi:hypothetical protein